MAFAQALAQREGARVTTHVRFGMAVLRLPEGRTIMVTTAQTAPDASPTALPTVEQRSLKHISRGVISPSIRWRSA